MKSVKRTAPDNSFWSLWIGVLGAALFLLAAFLGYQYRAYPALVFMGSISMAIAAHWNFRRHVTFWLGALVLVLAHTALVMFLPWPTWKMGGPEFAPFAFLDFLANFAAIRWTTMAIKRRERQAIAA